MNEDVKFCKDCKYYGKEEKCLHEKAATKAAGGISKFDQWLVDGKGERPDELEQSYAVVMRRYDCGVDGKLWEPILVREAA